MKSIILQTLGQKCIIKMNGNGHSEKDGIFIMPSLEASVWCILFTELTEKCEINELRPKVAASEPCDVGGR